MAEAQSTSGTMTKTDVKVSVNVKDKVEEPKERKELKVVFAEMEVRDRGVKVLTGSAYNLKMFASQPIPDMIIGEREKTKKKKARKGEQYSLSEFAFSQLCKYLNMPKEFINRLSPDLVKNICDWLLGIIEKEKKWGIKTKGKYIIGFNLDTEYKINSKDAIILVADMIPEENYILDWFNVDEGGIHLRVILPNKEIYKNEETKDTVFAGLHINISEFQQFTPKISFIMCREKGGSAIVPIFKGRRFFRVRNVKTLDLLNAELQRCMNPFDSRIDDIVGMCKKQMEKAISYKTNKDELSKELDKQRLKYKFAKTLCEKTIERFEKEEQNIWGAMWAFAHVSAKIKNINDRLAEEYMAGLLLDSI